jgi:hypothetical protein
VPPPDAGQHTGRGHMKKLPTPNRCFSLVGGLPTHGPGSTPGPHHSPPRKGHQRLKARRKGIGSTPHETFPIKNIYIPEITHESRTMKLQFKNNQTVSLMRPLTHLTTTAVRMSLQTSAVGDSEFPMDPMQTADLLPNTTLRPPTNTFAMMDDRSIRIVPTSAAGFTG